MTPKDELLVREAIEGSPSRESLWNSSRSWSIMMFDYGLSRVRWDTNAEARSDTREWLLEFREAALFTQGREAFRAQPLIPGQPSRTAAGEDKGSLIAASERVVVGIDMPRSTLLLYFAIAAATFVTAAIAAWPVIRGWLK